MYLREIRIKVLRIKNVILTVLSVFNLLFLIDSLTSLIAIYWGDWETIRTAKRTMPSVRGIIVSIILLILIGISRRLIGDAQFYSGYFEGDLDGEVSCRDLADVTGKRPGAVRRRLKLLRLLYMKGFRMQKKDGADLAVLDSKTAVCECRSCGAQIEKRMYFTGVCPYCKSSDLFARVLTGERFYSISTDTKPQTKKAEYYTVKELAVKRAWFIILMLLGISVCVMFFFMMASAAGNLNDEQYMRQEILKPENHASTRIITNRLISTISWGTVFVIGLIPVIFSRISRIRSLTVADACSKCFARSRVPFVNAKALPDVTGKPGADAKRIRTVRRTMRLGYLQHCTLERHDEVTVALAKQITKDRCPNCGAPIVGAADAHYTCRYCGSRIMDVIRKK